MPERNDKTPDVEDLAADSAAPQAPGKQRRTVLDIIREQQEILNPTTEVDEDAEAEAPAESPLQPSPTNLQFYDKRTAGALREAARLLKKKKGEDEGNEGK